VAALPVGAARVRRGVFTASAFVVGALPAGSGLEPRAREPGNTAVGLPERVPAPRGAAPGVAVRFVWRRVALVSVGGPFAPASGAGLAFAAAF